MGLKKVISIFDTDKTKIINIWINSIKFQEIIKTYELDSEVIKKRYAFAVWDYYVNTVKNDKQAGISAIVSDFIKYLKRQKLKSYELFIVYSEFKNAIVEYCFDKNLQTLENIKDINDYFEKVFSEILNVYSKSIKDIEKALNKSIDIVDKYVLMSRCDKKGYITSVSSAFCDISGYKPHELIGSCYETLKYSGNKIRLLDEIFDFIKSGEIWKRKQKYRKKNGEYFWVKTTIHPNFDNIGKIIGFDAVYVDISAEVEFERQQTILIEQSKSAAMGEMISMIAHQWRQPLQAVSILVQKLSLSKVLEEEITDEMIEEVVDQVLNQLDYMSKTIDDFRDYFKPNKKKEFVYINDVVEKSIDFLEYIFKVNAVEVNYENKTNEKVEVYLNEIVQVLINLSKNSIDAIVENNASSRYINIKTYDEKGFLIIDLEDSAGGIDDKIMNKIFDPYFSTKHNKNGTGLGLYMSKQIIQEHSKGDISVKNTEFGSKFTVKLPLN